MLFHVLKIADFQHIRKVVCVLLKFVQVNGSMHRGGSYQCINNATKSTVSPDP